MENYIIIGIVIAVVAVGILSAIKHFRGQGGCCGGGDYRPKRKKLKGIRYQKTFRVEGMHCEHCKRRIEEAVNDLRGAAGRVDLKRGMLTVSYAEEVADEVILQKIERIGYRIFKEER